MAQSSFELVDPNPILKVKTEKGWEEVNIHTAMKQAQAVKFLLQAVKSNTDYKFYEHCKRNVDLIMEVKSEL